MDKEYHKYILCVYIIKNKKGCVMANDVVIFYLATVPFMAEWRTSISVILMFSEIPIDS